MNMRVHTHTMGFSRSRIAVLRICSHQTMFPTISSRRKWFQSKGSESIRRWGNFLCKAKASKYAPRDAISIQDPSIKYK